MNFVLEIGSLAVPGVLNKVGQGLNPAAQTTCKDAIAELARPRLEYQLNVKNRGSRVHTLLIETVGSLVRAGWPGGSEDKTLGPGESAPLIVSFTRSPNALQEFSLITLLEDDVPILNVTLDYSFHPDFVEVGYTSGLLISGPGKNFSLDYWLATGPAPHLYALTRACHWLTGDRVCNAYSRCGWMTTDNSDVAFTFALEGHDEGGASQRYSEGHIWARYQLVETPPRLVIPGPDLGR